MNTNLTKAEAARKLFATNDRAKEIYNTIGIVYRTPKEIRGYDSADLFIGSKRYDAMSRWEIITLTVQINDDLRTLN